MSVVPSQWTVTITADNAAATAQRAARTAPLRHFITSVSGSFSASQAALKLLQLKSGTTVIMQWHVATNFALAFSSPIALVPGELAELSLAASGTGGQVGAVSLSGFTL